MDNDVKGILKQIIANHGTLVYKKPNQLKSLLKDYCKGEFKKEIMALMLVVEEGIAEEIITLKDKNIINRQVKYLCDSTPISEEIAEWTVEAWYYSLGILDDVKVDKSVKDKFEKTNIYDNHQNETEYKTSIFSNGNKYVGELKNGIRQSQGTYIFPNGDKYIGEFKNGKMEGHGTYTFADGRKYEGKFKDGKYEGQGTFTYANGDRYVGEWKNGVHFFH